MPVFRDCTIIFAFLAGQTENRSSVFFPANQLVKRSYNATHSFEIYKTFQHMDSHTSIQPDIPTYGFHHFVTT